MPLFVMSALFLAFWFEPAARAGPLTASEFSRSVGRSAGVVLLVLVASFALGRCLAFQIRRRGFVTAAARRARNWGQRLLQAFSLVAFAWTIHQAGWPRVVAEGMGLRGVILARDVMMILPFVLSQAAIWWGLYPAERASREVRSDAPAAPGLARYMVLRAREAFGLVLPVAMVFSICQDLLERFGPETSRAPWAEVTLTAFLGTLVLILAPALIRLSWPTSPLPPGVLRDRLERLSRRFGFRCSDILVWDTGMAVVNAGVTGAFPWFRYVLLSDALLAYLDDREVEAVFGHEIGHIAHRHLGFFGLFFLGSVGIMALVGEGVDAALKWETLGWAPVGSLNANLETIAQATAALAAAAAYFLVVFGFLSRRFERQADVFGCRAVSCGRADCPPHVDLNGHSHALPYSEDLCPVGIQTFANTLNSVANLNGLRVEARSWRHGSIRRRIEFLRGLEGRPEAERRFQVGVGRLRWAFLVILVSVVAAAIRLGALRRLG